MAAYEQHANSSSSSDRTESYETDSEYEKQNAICLDEKGKVRTNH